MVVSVGKGQKIKTYVALNVVLAGSHSAVTELHAKLGGGVVHAPRAKVWLRNEAGGGGLCMMDGLWLKGSGVSRNIRRSERWNARGGRIALITLWRDGRWGWFWDVSWVSGYWMA